MSATVPPWVPDIGGESPEDWEDANRAGHDDEPRDDLWPCAGCGAHIPVNEEKCGDCIENGEPTFSAYDDGWPVRECAHEDGECHDPAHQTDLIEHEISEDCACGPTPEPVTRDDGSFGWVHVHHSLDNREAVE